MIRIATLALTTTIAVAVAAPAAMAQTGGTHHKAQKANVLKDPAPRYEVGGRPLYNMAPGNAPSLGRDTPAGTGGGSIGYNQMLYNW